MSFKKIIPCLLAIVIYGVITAIYFAPQITGEVLAQGDIRQYKGMAQEIEQTRERVGEDPQWSGSMFGGMPAYMINVEYPAQIIKQWVGGVTQVVDTPAAFIFFAMLSMWLMLVMMGVGGYVAIVGGAMYGLSTYFFLIIGAGHLTKMWALVYAPLLMGAIHMTLRGNMLWGAALTALFTSLELGANHPQITYYFLLAAAIFWLSELYFAYGERGLSPYLKRTALLCAAGVLGLLSNLSPLWYAAEHTPDTIRGGSEIVQEREAQQGGAAKGGLDLDYATAWSYGIDESLNLLIPDFMGRDSAHTFAKDGAVAATLKPYGAESIAQQLPTYWGTQPFTAGPTYLGAVVILLALIGFGLSRGRERWWILAVTIFMMLLSWGYNFMWFTELAFSALPLYNKFRVVSMTLVVVEWSIPLLASYGLWQLWRAEGDMRREQRVVAISAAIVGGVTLCVTLFAGAIFSFGQQEAVEMLIGAQFPEQLAYEVSRAMAQERGAMVSADGWRTLIFVLLTAAAIFGYLFSYIKHKGVMLTAIGLLVLFDLGGVAQRFLNNDDFGPTRRNRIVATDIDREILADKGEAGYRVLNLTVSPFNDATTSYFHRSVGGYHGAKLSRYQDLIDRYLSKADSATLDMLNTRYIIAPEGLITRPTALGAAWFVGRAMSSDSPTEQLEALSTLDLSREAIVEGADELNNMAFMGGEIELVEYLPHHLTYKYKADGKALAIFSEIYYDKGWRAYVDGVEHPYLRANYLLRAMVLPEGEHTVEWRFRAPHWGVIEGVTLVASLIILLSIIILILRWVRIKN